MSVTNGNAVYYTIGGGNVGPYAFVLDYDDPDEIIGISQNADDSITTHTQASIDEANQTVTFNEGASSGSTLAIYRNTPKTQLEQFRRRGDFSAERHDNAIDKLFHTLQRLWHDSEAGMRIDHTYSSFDVRLPYDLTQHADAGIQVNAAGTGLGALKDIQLIADAVDAANAAESSAIASANSASRAAVHSSSSAASAASMEPLVDAAVSAAPYVETAIRDLGTVGGEAYVGELVTVDTSSGAVTVDVRAGGMDHGTLTIKSNVPYQEKITLSGGGDIDGFSSIDMWHPYQSITLSRNNLEWSVIGECNDLASASFPEIEYVDDDTFTIRRKFGRLDFISVYMGDGSLWHYDGSSLTIDLDVSGDGGLDTGTRANDTPYYAYLVPDPSAWRTLKAICSASDPDTGPTGYTDWSYVGAVVTDSSGDIKRFVQSGNKFFFNEPRDWQKVVHVTGSTGPTSTWTQFTSTPILPSTYSMSLLHFFIDSDTGWVKVWITGSDTGSAPTYTPKDGWGYGSITIAAGTTMAAVGQRWLPATDTGEYYYRWTKNTSALDLYVTVVGWADGYLPA